MLQDRPVNITIRIRQADWEMLDSALRVIKDNPDDKFLKDNTFFCKKIAVSLKDYLQAGLLTHEVVNWNETCRQSRKPKPLTKQERIDQLLRELQVLLKEKEE